MDTIAGWLHLPYTPLTAAVLATLVSGWLATTVGALPALALSRVTLRTSTILIGVAAGLMLGAALFALLLPALEVAGRDATGALAPAAAVTVALLVGAGTLAVANRWLPHEHFVKGPEGGARHGGPAAVAAPLPRALLLAVAIAIHNFPEGLSVGIGAGSGDLALSGTLMAAMALQNLPEGLVVAIGLRTSGYGRWTAVGLASATGLVELGGGCVGGASLALSTGLLPWALAFAAGAMLYVISDEIIPESHRPGMEERATASLFGGLALFLLLNAAIADWNA